MQQLFSENQILLTIIFLALIAWTFPWKAVALWKAARNGHLAWFIILMIFNTLAILEIIYIFIFSKKKENPSLKKINVSQNVNPASPANFGNNNNTQGRRLIN